MIENNILLSIVIPVYNAEKTLETCLDSILNQSCIENIEIICVNDGSSDNSWHILQQYYNNYPKTLSIFSKKNGGPSSARNLALQNAQGEFLSFIDSDDYISENYLNSIISTLKEHKDIDILEIGTNSVVNGFIYPLIVNQSKLGFKENFVYQCKYFLFARVINRSICQDIFFDENLHLCEDAVFLTACYAKASIFFRIDEAIYNYVANLNSLTHGKSKQHISNLDYIINISKEKLKIEDPSNLLYLGLMGNMLYFRKGLNVLLTKQVTIDYEEHQEIEIFYKYKKNYERFGRRVSLRFKVFVSLRFQKLSNSYTLVRYG